jgi:hypothetical protein
MSAGIVGASCGTQPTKTKFKGKRIMTETTNLIALWLADVFKRDDTGKLEVYTESYREAWKTSHGKPPVGQGDDLTESVCQDKENGKDGNKAAK